MTEQQVEKTFNLAKKWSWEISLLRELWPGLGGALAIGGAAGSAIAILPGIFLLIPIGFAAIFGSLGRLFTGKWNPEIIEFLARYFGYFLNICFYLALPAATIVFLGGFAWFILQALWEQWQVPAFLRVWRTFVFLYEMGNPLCEKAKMLNTRIEALLGKGGEWFLPSFGVARFLNRYQEKLLELQQINEELERSNNSYQELSEKLKIVNTTINRTHYKAEANLKNIANDVAIKSNQKKQCEIFIMNLEALVKKAEDALYGLSQYKQIDEYLSECEASVTGEIPNISKIFEEEIIMEMESYRESQTDRAIDMIDLKNAGKQLNKISTELKKEEKQKKKSIISILK